MVSGVIVANTIASVCFGSIIVNSSEFDVLPGIGMCADEPHLYTNSSDTRQNFHANRSCFSSA
jgi:hypothetical protein